MPLISELMRFSRGMSVRSFGMPQQNSHVIKSALSLKPEAISTKAFTVQSLTPSLKPKPLYTSMLSKPPSTGMIVDRRV